MSPYLSADSEAIAEYISGTQKSSAEHSINLEDTLQDHPESNYPEIPRKVCYQTRQLQVMYRGIMHYTLHLYYIVVVIKSSGIKSTSL